MRDARVDAYIAKRALFAREVLNHVRELMHLAVPEVEETVRWSMPFFELRGVILGNMAGFKEHCSVGLWGPEMAKIPGDDEIKSSEGMGKFGKITCLKDLPRDKVLVGYFKQAAGLIKSGERTTSLVRVAKKKVAAAQEIPAELMAALKKNKSARTTFDGFSPSCRREYAEWVAEAKRVETKEKRVAQAVEWMAEGKTRHWKYQDC